MKIFHQDTGLKIYCTYTNVKQSSQLCFDTETLMNRGLNYGLFPKTTVFELNKHLDLRAVITVIYIYNQHTFQRCQSQDCNDRKQSGMFEAINDKASGQIKFLHKYMDYSRHMNTQWQCLQYLL